MSIIKMSKVSMIGLEEDRQKILGILHKIGCMQITDTDASSMGSIVDKYECDARTGQIDELLNDISKAREALLQYDIRKKSLFDPKRSINKHEYDQHMGKDVEIYSRVKEINELIYRTNELSSEKNKHNNQINSLMPWVDLDIDLDHMHTKYTTAVIGVIPNHILFDSMKSELYEEHKEIYVKLISSDSTQKYLYIISLSRDTGCVFDMMKRYGFNQVVFKNLYGTAKDIVEKTKGRITEIDVLKHKIENEIRDRAKDINDIEILYDSLLLEKQRLDKMAMLAKTDKTFMVEGWIPERQKKVLSEKVNGGGMVYLQFRDPVKDEDYPILLENRSFIKPFELITELFSLPNSREFDVNPFMAPFYFVFFGIMIGDAGYGLIIMLISGIMLLRYKIKGTMKKLISMLFFGGISTFIWGALFGSWFGDIIGQVSLGRFAIKPFWFDPLKDPMKLLIFSCILGVIQLYVGFALRGYKMWILGKKTDAIIDIGLRYVYYSGLIMLLVSVPFAKYVALTGAVGLVLTQGRHKKGFGKVTGGILSLYDFVGFVSDVLSYSRLLALGLATGVVASVVNTMGMIFGVNVLGIVVLVIVFVAGHIFNMTINTIGAYVHASRLQYVEFFSKFYEGGGKPFRPFKYDTKYININDGGGINV